MTTRQNLHMHCSFCDGANTMEEMLLSCMKAGLTSVGFSSHSPTGFSFDTAAMKAEKLSSYFDEINYLKDKYNFPVYAGLEYESRTADGPVTILDSRCNYTIGSTHFYEKDGNFVNVDWDIAHYLEAFDCFGSPRALMENYYNEVVSFSKRSSYDITGHFDLVTKFEETPYMPYLSEKWYKDLAISSLEEVASTGKIFEVNTGGIARLYKNTFYPADFLLRRLKELKAPIIISSDSHNVNTVVCAFARAEEYLKSLGFSHQMTLTDNGFKAIAL